ncbi:MAG: hypothetical protein K5981_07400 [Clostridia bacterium]|nr:hypothetical protein [Clostridia bacterium]
MSSFLSVSMEPLGIVLRLAALVLMPVQMALFFQALGQKRNSRALALNALHALAGLCFLVLLYDGCYRIAYLPYVREYPAAVLALGSLPWLAIAALEGASAALCAVSARDVRQFAAVHPSEQAIKQTVDLLPAGVCVSGADGTVLLSNLAMDAFCRDLTGGPLLNAEDFLQAVRDAGEPQNGRLLVRLAGDKAYLFEENTMQLEDETYQQLTAEDVSDQFRVTKELEAENARLRALQVRMKAYQVHTQELAVRQELLAARTLVHSQLGGALLTGRYAFEHPEATDRKALRRMLQQINTYLLAEVEDPEPRAGELEETLRMAAGIGISVRLQGEPPEEEKLRSLLAQAVGECAVNAVKHAGADRLDVKIGEAQGLWRFELANNGQPPKTEIIPSGGLASLAAAVRQAGGEMRIESRPEFKLIMEVHDGR